MQNAVKGFPVPSAMPCGFCRNLQRTFVIIPQKSTCRSPIVVGRVQHRGVNNRSAQGVRVSAAPPVEPIIGEHIRVPHVGEDIIRMGKNRFRFNRIHPRSVQTTCRLTLIEPTSAHWLVCQHPSRNSTHLTPASLRNGVGRNTAPPTNLTTQIT